MTKHQYNNATGIFSTQLAIGSFIIGTLLLMIHLQFPESIVIIIGFLFVVFAIIFNLILLVQLTYLLITQKKHFEYYTIKILILLANVPITIVYLKIVFQH